MREVDAQFCGLGLKQITQASICRTHLLVMEARLRTHQCQRQSTSHLAVEWYRRTPERRLRVPLRLKYPCCLLNLNAIQDRTGPGQSLRRRTGGVRFAGQAWGSKDWKTRHNGCSSLATLRVVLSGYDRSGRTLSEDAVVVVFSRARGFSVGGYLQSSALAVLL